MNVHLLRHYGRMIRICGPLWSSALFGFEANIGTIKQFVCGTTDVLQQITEKYVISKALLMDASVYEHEEIQNKLYQQKTISLKDHHQKVLMNANILCDPDKFTIYRRFKSNGYTYTCILSKETKASDFFLQLDDGTLGISEFYFKINEDMFVFLNKYEISYTHYHIKEIKKSSESIICACSRIKKKLLYLAVSGIEYISEKSNKYFV